MNPKVARVIEISALLEERKALYKELEQLVDDLVTEKFKFEIMDDMIVELVDLFAEKNTAFRPAVFRRYEIQVRKYK